MDKVSICIPTYNGEQYLRSCLDSVLSQDHWNLEILVVDDCSSDHTLKIAEEYAEYDERINIHQNEQNLGLVGNWNRCLELASADWIKFVFQDDLIHPHCIREMLTHCKKYNVKLGITQRNFIIEANASSNIRDFFQKKVKKLDHHYKKHTHITPNEAGDILGENLMENIIGEPTVLLFHKDIIKQYGKYNEDLSQMVDYEFAAKIMNNEGCAFLSFPYAYFRIHGDAESDKNKSNRRSIEKFRKVEYVDNILMSSAMLNDPHFINIRKNKAPLKSLLGGLYFKLINEQGIEEARIILQPFSKKYSYLEEELEAYNKLYLEKYSVSEISNLNKEQFDVKFHINQINDTPPHSQQVIEIYQDMIYLDGWAFDEASMEALGGIYVQIGDKKRPALYGDPSPGVAEHFNADQLTNCSFKIRIPLTDVDPGDYDMNLYFLDKDQKTFAAYSQIFKLALN